MHSRRDLIFCWLLLAATASAAPDNMRAGWGITVLEDDVLRLAVQMGVRDVVVMLKVPLEGAVLWSKQCAAVRT